MQLFWEVLHHIGIKLHHSHKWADYNLSDFNMDDCRYPSGVHKEDNSWRRKFEM
jgi:hypothetical protein